MPPFNETNKDQKTGSILLLGDTKAGKTRWMAQAAEAGFNVLYVDGDVAAPTLAQLSPAAQARVFYLPVHDFINENGDYINAFAEFMVAITTTNKFMWNDTLCRPFSLMDYKPEEGHVVWEIRPTLMGGWDVFILDSWTTLVQSLITWKADDLNIDLMEIEKYNREMYTGAGHKATQMLKLIRALPCHLGVVGHPREYVKRSAPKGSKGVVQEKDMKIDWIQMVPVSTSNPHGLTLGANFSDIAWIDVSPTGNRTIDFKPSDARVIGGAFTDSKPVDERTFMHWVTQIGGTRPAADHTPDRWLTRYGPGEYQPAAGRIAPVLGLNRSATPTTIATPPPPGRLSILTGLKRTGAPG